MKLARLVLGIIILAMSPLVVLTGTVYTLLLPNLYEAAARITVQGDAVCESPCEHCVYISPSFIQTEMMVLKSKPVLYEVMKRLELQQRWGTGGAKLPRSIALKILNQSLRISQLRGTTVIEIAVRRDNPDEAAELANEIALVYRDRPVHTPADGLQSSLRKAEIFIEDQSIRLEDAEEKVQALIESDLIETDAVRKELQLAISGLRAEQFVHTQLEQKKRDIIRDLDTPTVHVEIIDVAEPNRRPVSPNLFLNVLLSMVQAGIMGMVGLFLILSGRRREA